jgi:hypothetical protein
VVAQNPWQPTDEIAQLRYFGRGNLPQPIGLGALVDRGTPHNADCAEQQLH